MIPFLAYSWFINDNLDTILPFFDQLSSSKWTLLTLNMNRNIYLFDCATKKKSAQKKSAQKQSVQKRSAEKPAAEKLSEEKHRAKKEFINKA